MTSSVARPFSLLQPPSSSVDHSFSDLSPLRRPRSARADSPFASSSRPISLLYPSNPSRNEERLTPTFSKRHSLIKAPSFASLNMAFGFKSEKSKEKEKANERGKEKLQRPRTASETSARSFEPFSLRQRADSSSKPLPILPTDPQPPSTSQGRFYLQVPSMRGMKKKRSLASLLPAANESSTPTPNLQAPSSARSKSTNDSVTSPTLLHDPDLDVPDLSTSKRLPKRHNMRVRPAENDHAPYMQAYDPILLENDRCSDTLLRRLNPIDGPSFHDYESHPPSGVLDLGCGTGNWMLSAAAAWPESKFTGFDLVDVLDEDTHISDNITFVKGDFLQFPWSLESDSFDLVRMANLSLCVPHDLWDAILREVHRVLRINGRIELIDDEILFPYAAPLPRSRPTSIPGFNSPRYTTTPPRKKGISFIDSDTDDDTLEGNDSDDDYGTASSESTLTSERDFPFSLNHNNISPPISRNNSHYHRRSSLRQSHDSEDLARTPTSPSHPLSTTSTITTSPDSIDFPSPSWRSRVAASQELERVFENMLRFKFGMYLQPSEVMAESLNGVFANSEEIGTYQLKLAPPDAAKPLSSPAALNEKDEKMGEVRTMSRKINDITKSWEGRWQNRKASKISNHELPPLDTQFLPVDTIPDRLSSKAAARLGILEDSPPADHRVPERLSTKAASRLGISVLGDLKRNDEMVLSPVVENAGESESESDVESVTSTPTPGNYAPAAAGRRSDDGHDMISAKAAHRLGISYTALTQAAKASKRPLSSSSTLVSNSGIPATAQSPGLIVEATSEFIPLSPSELEMHACKNIHMLIGCKPALLDFNASFVDKQGNLFQSEKEFDLALWDYECFRRSRFNWPSECPDMDFDTPDLDDIASPALSLKATSTPKTPSSHYRKSSDKYTSELPSGASPLDESLASLTPTLTPAINELTHVRTIRVYEAVKTSEHPVPRRVQSKLDTFRPLPPISPPSPLVVSHIPSAPRIQISSTL